MSVSVCVCDWFTLLVITLFLSAESGRFAGHRVPFFGVELSYDGTGSDLSFYLPVHISGSYKG